MFARPRRLLRRGVSIAAGLTLVFTACEQPTSFFDDYQDINLIRDGGLDSDAWRLVADTAARVSITNLDDYVAVQEVHPDGTAADTDGSDTLPIGTTDEDIRRLEILNLFPNGDFDEPSIDDWVSSDGGTDAIRSLVTDPTLSDYVVDGNSLEYDIQSQEVWIQHPLSGSNGLTDGFVGDLYTARFDLRTDRENIFAYFTQDPSTLDWSLQRDWFTTTLSGTIREYRFGVDETRPDPEFNVAPQGAAVDHYLTIGEPEAGVNADRIPVSGSLDNVRIARSDIAPRLELLVPVEDNPYGPLDLPSGFYRFSVYVRTDPTHTNDTLDPADNVSNRFPADRVTLSMTVRETDDGEIIGDFHQSVSTAQSSNGWAEWTQVEVTGFLQTSDGDYTQGDLEVDLTVSPTDLAFPSGLLPGSLLITQPRLELLSD